MGQQPNIEPGLSAAPRTKLGPAAARSWRPGRPGELDAPVNAPSGGLFGVAGPDAGYALKLAGERSFALHPGEHHHDVVAAGAAIACARAAKVGRAPTADDVSIAMTILGLDPAVPASAGSSTASTKRGASTTPSNTRSANPVRKAEAGASR